MRLPPGPVIPDLPSGADFAGRYTIIEQVGAGGMGVIYKATDRSLGQHVALKMIQPALATHPSFIERFKREVRVTRDITHPNVCRVHDLGEEKGNLFISMAFIEGESLRMLLRRAGRLDVERALRIAEQIAEALQAAHDRGVVHRDLKPENVMIDNQGLVRVMDFGLATDLASVEPNPSAQPMGTIPYTAPEQMRGECVDGRADVYALGLMLHEMLTGIHPGAPASVRSRVGAELPGRILRVIAQMTAPEPERRSRSALEAARTIRMSLAPDAGRTAAFLPRGRRAGHASLLIAALGILFLLSVLAYRSFQTREPHAMPREAEAFYQRGIFYLREEAESVKSLSVARSMFQRALATAPDNPLVLAAIGETSWIRFGRTGDRATHDEAADHVARAMALAPDLPEARNAHARGLIAGGNFAPARDSLRRLTEEHPDLDAAWANLGRAHIGLLEYDEARRAINRAIGLKPGSFQHRVLAGILHETFHEYDAAEQAYRTAIELKPDSSIAWSNLGAILLRTSPESAVEALERSLDIEDNPLARSNIGTAFYFMERYEEAIEQYRRAVVLDPANADYRGNLGDALSAIERNEDAAREWLEAAGLALRRIAVVPSDPAAHTQLAIWCGRAGLTDCAEREANLAREMRPLSAEVLFRYAVISATIGRQDEALEWLGQAVALGLARMEIRNEPGLAPIREDPRYSRLLDRAQ